MKRLLTFLIVILISLIIIKYFIVFNIIKDELYITDHTLTVYYEDCVRDFAIQNPSSTIFDLVKDISPECKSPEIDYLHGDYNYLFLLDLNRLNENYKIAQVEIIGMDENIINKFDLNMHPKDDSIYIFISHLNVSKSEIVTFKVSILDDDEILDEYSFKFKVFGAEIVV